MFPDVQRKFGWVHTKHKYNANKISQFSVIQYFWVPKNIVIYAYRNLASQALPHMDKEILYSKPFLIL